MRNEEIKAELAALRAEVVALSQARQQTARPKEEEPAPVTAEETATESEREGLMGEIQELIELLETELRETPVVSGLVIFSLGILVGRFLR
jgi:hypothetical protein